MKTTIIVLLILFTACSKQNKKNYRIHIQNENIYGNISDGKPARDKLIVNSKGQDTISIGKFAVTAEKQLSNLKTGLWKSFYPNGKLKEEGKYKIGGLIDCCFGGLCMQYYHYKSGIWKYFSTEGQLKFELNYVTDTLHVETRCGGGDRVAFGLIKDISHLEYKYGLTPDSIFQYQKVEMENETTIAVPISGELIFRSK